MWEKPDTTVEKGTLKNVNGLFGGRYQTRNKMDLRTREEELQFLFSDLEEKGQKRRDNGVGVLQGCNVPAFGGSHQKVFSLLC